MEPQLRQPITICDARVINNTIVYIENLLQIAVFLRMQEAALMLMSG